MPKFKEFADDEPREASAIAATAIDSATDWQSADRHLVTALQMHEQVLDDLRARVERLERELRGLRGLDVGA